MHVGALLGKVLVPGLGWASGVELEQEMDAVLGTGSGARMGTGSVGR